MFKSWFSRSSSRVAKSRSSRHLTRKLRIESLEDRRLLTITYTADPNLQPGWVEQGPGPIQFAGNSSNVENLLGGNVATGGVESIVSDPTNASVIYAGTVNGGVWGTTTGGATWIPLTDNITIATGVGTTGLAGLSIGAVTMDLTDPTHHTIYAGIGDSSSNNAAGSALTGVLKTTDGGVTWVSVANTSGTLGGSNFFAGMNISSIWARGRYVVVGVDNAWAATAGVANVGLYFSNDFGATFTAQFTGSEVSDIVADPRDDSVLYIGTTGRFGGTASIRVANLPASPAVAAFLPLTNISAGFTAITNPLTTVDNVKIAVHNNLDGYAVYVAVSDGGQLADV
jgi:hypothetical protein